MKKTLIGLSLAAGLLLTGCASSTPGPADHYTGKATIKESYRNSSKTGCKLVIKLPNGQEDTVRVGRRTTCNGWDAGRVITLTNGVLNK